VSASRRELLALAIGSAILFGLRLGARDLWNPNEPIYGEAVREMAQRGEWLLPYVNGVVFAEKPILYYWLALVSSKLLGGVSELALRLPSCLAGIGIVLGTYALVLPYAGRARALASAIASATLFGVFSNARFVQMDILVTVETLWVVILVTRILDYGRPRLPGYLLAGAIAGLGFLAKGPVAWICPGLPLFAYLAATRRFSELLRWEVLAGLVACLFVACPWYVALIAQGRTEVVLESLVRQNVERFVSPWDHQAPWWYFLQYVWVDMAPWAFFVPLAIRLERATEGERRLALLAWIWIAMVVGFFSLSRSKRSPYILPVAPAVAVLAGELAVAFVVSRLDDARRRWFLGATGAVAGALALGGAAIIIGAPRWLLPAAAIPAAVLGATALIGGALVMIGLLRSRTRWMAPVSLAVAVVAVYLAAAGVTLPALDVYKSVRPMCEKVDRLLRPGDEVASYEFWTWRAEFRYYLGRPITNLQGPEALREAWNGPRRLVLFVERSRWDSARRVIGDVTPVVTNVAGGRPILVVTNR
jgi:4-amino-4-deoxy-L-arabinose transferase-like glycosyltransferase